MSGRQEETKEKLCATKKILPVKIPGVLSAKMSQALPAQAAPPAKMSKTLPPEVLKVDKKLPVQVSEAPIKPTKASSSTVSLAPPAITKNPFPAPAVYLAASVLVKYLNCSSLLIRVLNKTTSAPAPSVAAPVLEPGCRCFLQQGVLWYSIQVHAVIHEELVSARNLGQGLFQGVHPRAAVLLPGNLPRGAGPGCPVGHRVIMQAGLYLKNLCLVLVMIVDHQ